MRRWIVRKLGHYIMRAGNAMADVGGKLWTWGMVPIRREMERECVCGHYLASHYEWDAPNMAGCKWEILECTKFEERVA
jgi:hypothetical protein